MSEGLKHTRNIAIILAIAAGVYFVPGGGRVANTVAAALWTAFALGAGYLGLPFSSAPLQSSVRNLSSELYFFASRSRISINSFSSALGTGGSAGLAAS